MGLLFAAFLVLTLYIYYVHWKYSHIPSPKMPRYIGIGIVTSGVLIQT